MTKKKSANDLIKQYMFPHSAEVKAALKEAHDCVSNSYWKMWKNELLKSKYTKAVNTFIKQIKSIKR